MTEQVKIGSRFGSTADLPEELRKELTLKTSSYSDIEAYIENEFNGIATMDELLICHYRKTGQILKRSALTQELYKMQKDGRIYSVNGKRGVYTTSKKLARNFPKDSEEGFNWWK